MLKDVSPGFELPQVEQHDTADLVYGGDSVFKCDRVVRLAAVGFFAFDPTDNDLEAA